MHLSRTAGRALIVVLVVVTSSCGRTRLADGLTPDVPVEPKTGIAEDAAATSRDAPSSGGHDAAVGSVADRSAVLDTGAADSPRGIDVSGSTAAAPPGVSAAVCQAWGRTIHEVRCETCAASANSACSSTWRQLSDSCQPSVFCAQVHCLCNGPGCEADPCSCVVTCLRPTPDLCSQLWARLAQCVTSRCPSCT